MTLKPKCSELLLALLAVAFVLPGCGGTADTGLGSGSTGTAAMGADQSSGLLLAGTVVQLRVWGRTAATI